MKAVEKLKEIAESLKTHGFEPAGKEAEILVKHGLGISTVKIFSDNPELSEEQIITLENMLRRRLRREPIQYILGYEEFLGLKLLVSPGVLIPRPETELMAEQAIKTVTSYKLQVASKNKSFSLVPRPSSLVPSPLSLVTCLPDRQARNSSLSILDLCTGSGCLAIALAKEFPDCEVYGTDISETAIEYARKNAIVNNINNVTFLKGNLFEPFCHPELVSGSKQKMLKQAYPEEMPKQVRHDTFRGQHDSYEEYSKQCQFFNLIISNPPYVRTGDIKRLQPEIKDWEPAAALDGGADGLGLYRELIPAAKGFLKDGGIIMLEVGFGQSGRVADIIKSSGYELLEIIKDYAGIERIIKAKWKR